MAPFPNIPYHVKKTTPSPSIYINLPTRDRILRSTYIHVHSSIAKYIIVYISIAGAFGAPDKHFVLRPLVFLSSSVKMYRARYRAPFYAQAISMDYFVRQLVR